MSNYKILKLNPHIFFLKSKECAVYQTKAKEKEEILQDPYMQDIERNLEVTAQAAIDIANRIISIILGTRLNPEFSTFSSPSKAIIILLTIYH